LTIQGEEFVYRLPVSSVGSRPGAHRGSSRGAGMSFAAHAKLFDQPDPRRLDLRASISDVRGDWLVRTYLQPASITVYVLLDISESMKFGHPGKLQVAAKFLHCLGLSAYAYGDAISLLPFDSRFREDLYFPARRGRAAGALMADAVLSASANRDPKGHESTPAALDRVADRIVGATGLVFMLSDFHWPLDKLGSSLEKLSSATVVPLVVWDKAEVTPPAAGQLLFASELESQNRRQLWLTERKRTQWRDGVQQKRQELIDLFARFNSAPLFIENAFNAESMSRYFMEHVS